MGKLYENKELWKKASTAILKKLRADGKINLTDEEIDKKVDALINDTKRIEIHKMAAKIKEKTAKQSEIYDQVKQEYIKEHGGEISQHGFNIYIYGKIDISGTPEAHEKNKKLMEQICGNKESRKLLGEFVKQCYKSDLSKFYTNDLNELFNLYYEHTDEVIGLFSIDRVFATVGNYKMNPEFKQYYSQCKQLFEGCGVAKTAIDYYSNPAILLFPDDLDAQMLLAESSSITKEISSMLKEQNIDGLVFDPSGTNCVSISGVGGGKLPYEMSLKEAKPINDLMEKGQVPKTIAYEYKILKDGEEVKDYNSALIKMSEGEKYDIVKRTPEELKKLDNAMNHCVEDKELSKNFFEKKKAELTSLRDELKKAKNWYQPKSFNHKEYNDLMNKLDSTINTTAVWTDHDTTFQAFADIKKLSNAYIIKNMGSTNKMRQTRMDICSKINGLCVLEGKTMDDFYTALDGNEPVLEQKAEIEKIEVELNIDNDNDKSIIMDKEDLLADDLNKSFVDENTKSMDDDSILGLK